VGRDDPIQCPDECAEDRALARRKASCAAMDGGGNYTSSILIGSRSDRPHAIAKTRVHPPAREQTATRMTSNLPPPVRITPPPHNRARLFVRSNGPKSAAQTACIEAQGGGGGGPPESQVQTDPHAGETAGPPSLGRSPCASVPIQATCGWGDRWTRSCPIPPCHAAVYSPTPPSVHNEWRV